MLSFWLINRRGYWTWHIDLGDLRALVTFGAKLHLGNVATIVASKLDIVVLSLYASAGVLGIYVVATALGTVVGLVPGAVALVLFPSFVRLSSAARQMTLARLLLIGSIVTFIAGPIMTIALPQLIPLVFGRAFLPAVPVAEVLVIGYLFRGYNGMLVAMLRGAGKPLQASTGELMGFVLFAICLPPLTGRFGSVGTATALTVAAAGTLGWLVVQACISTQLSLAGLWSSWKADLTRLPASSIRRSRYQHSEPRKG
jgi:O-antigen/teichoic acid export membrane protein